MRPALFAPQLVISATWQMTLLTVLAAIVVAGVAIWLTILLIRQIERLVMKRQMVIKQIKIHNTGNVPGVIQLAAVAPANELGFQYILDGRSIVVKPPVLQPAIPSPAPVPTQSPAAAPVKTSSSVPGSPTSGKSGAVAGAKAAKAASKKALGKGRVVISIIGTLGSLIPGDIGKSLKDRATQMQAQAQKAGEAIELPEQKILTAKSLQDQVKTLGPAQATAQSGSPQAVGNATPAVNTSKPVDQAATPAVQTLPKPKVIGLDVPYIQTPVIPPNGSLVVELRIQPKNRFRSMEWSYWLISRQVEQELVLPVHPLETQRSLQTLPVKSLPLSFNLLAVVLEVAVVCLNAWWAVELIQWISRLIA